MTAGNKAIIDTADNNYLIDGQGMSLYLFEPDEQGQSTCYDACAKVWPPLIAKDEAVAKGKVDAALPGDIKGQDVEGFGGEWYLVAPSGDHMEEDEDEEKEGSSSGASY